MLVSREELITKIPNSNWEREIEWNEISSIQGGWWHEIQYPRYVKYTHLISKLTVTIERTYFLKISTNKNSVSDVLKIKNTPHLLELLKLNAEIHPSLSEIQHDVVDQAYFTLNISYWTHWRRVNTFLFHAADENSILQSADVTSADEYVVFDIVIHNHELNTIIPILSKHPCFEGFYEGGKLCFRMYFLDSLTHLLNQFVELDPKINEIYFDLVKNFKPIKDPINVFLTRTSISLFEKMNRDSFNQKTYWRKKSDCIKGLIITYTHPQLVITANAGSHDSPAYLSLQALVDYWEINPIRKWKLEGIHHLKMLLNSAFFNDDVNFAVVKNDILQEMSPFLKDRFQDQKVAFLMGFHKKSSLSQIKQSKMYSRRLLTGIFHFLDDNESEQDVLPAVFSDVKTVTSKRF